MRSVELTISSAPNAPSIDERRAVGRAPLAAIRLPAVLARLLVEGKQIRSRRLVAEQDQQVAVEHRRAAVSPLDVERAVLGREVPLPDDRAGSIERDDLAGAEPGEDERAVGDRARASRGCACRARASASPVASIRRSQTRLPSARPKASTTKKVLAGSAPAAASTPSARSPCAAASAPCTRRGWLPSRLTPAPICEVT